MSVCIFFISFFYFGIEYECFNFIVSEWNIYIYKKNRIEFVIKYDFVFYFFI